MAFMMASLRDPCCFRCGQPYAASERILRVATCASCDADLHCCLNCRHHDRSAHNECNEPQAEWVRDRERANHCDYFEPRRGPSASTGSTAAKDARVRFEDLFRK
jgi:hypothetical protein